MQTNTNTSTENEASVIKIALNVVMEYRIDQIVGSLLD